MAISETTHLTKLLELIRSELLVHSGQWRVVYRRV